MRQYYIYVGSRDYFEERIATIVFSADELTEKVLEHDRLHNTEIPYKPSDCLVVRNNHYLSIVDSAHARLGALLEDLTTDSATLYIHNPPYSLMQYLTTEARSGRCEIIVKDFEKRPSISSASDVKMKLQELGKEIVGQDEALREIGKSLLYLSKTRRYRPFVFMLYGNSSLGKTETAKAIARVFYQNKMIEKHMSMFASTGYANYLFGDRPNKASLGYDLNQRESNLVFLDEIDKCPDVFHSAFYSLFDSPTYLDATYEVDIHDLVVILTCNYLNEGDIKKYLGDPIYFRIDKCVRFADLDSESQLMILRNEVARQLAELSIDVDNRRVLAAAAGKIPIEGSNARTIRSVVRDTIEEFLYAMEP